MLRIDKSEWKLSEALAHFRNRDASQLWTISEEEVLEGLALVEDELIAEPGADSDARDRHYCLHRHEELTEQNRLAVPRRTLTI